MANSDDFSSTKLRDSDRRDESRDDSRDDTRAGGTGARRSGYAAKRDGDIKKESPVNPEAASLYGAKKPHSKDMKMTNPLEIEVSGGVEKAIKVLKRKLIKEGLFRELKSRRFYEKPSDRRKRKEKEALKKLRKEAARRQKNQMMF